MSNIDTEKLAERVGRLLDLEPRDTIFHDLITLLGEAGHVIHIARVQMNSHSEIADGILDRLEPIVKLMENK